MPSPEADADVSRRVSGRTKWQFVETVAVALAIVAMQLVQGILLARLLGPEGRGEYATAVLYVQLLLFVGLWGGHEVLSRHAAAKTGHPYRTLWRAAWKLTLVTATATTLIAMALSIFAMPADKRHLIPLAVICSLSLAGQQVVLMVTGVDRGRSRFHAYNLRRLIACAAFPILLAVAALSVPITVSLASWLMVVASVVGAAVCAIDFGSAADNEFMAAESEPMDAPELSVRSMVREAQPYGVSMLATDLFERLDLVLVLWLAPLIEQGFYAAMLPAVYPLTIVPNTVGVFLFNAGADRGSQLSRPELAKVLASTLAVQTICTAIFIALIGYVVTMVYGEAFAPATRYAIWLAPASAIKGVLQSLDLYLRGCGRPMAVVGARVGAAILMLAIALSLYGSMGVLAVAVGCVAGQVFCLSWATMVLYRHAKPVAS